MKINKKYIKEKLFYVFAVGISILFLFFFVIGTCIGHEVKNVCKNAKREHEGDCIEALIMLVDDENKGFRQRNSAIWTLGQLGDSRALPTLQKFYTGNIPQKEPLDDMISQYELKKAINLLDNGFNITSFIWRGFVDEK